MTSKEAVKLAYTEFQKDFEEGEETNQWLTDVINGLKKAEKDLEVLELILKNRNIIFAERSNYDNMSADDFLKLSRWLSEN